MKKILLFLLLFSSPVLAQNISGSITGPITGSGNNVLSNSPTLVTPILGVATITSVNKLAITAPATSATLTIANTKTLTASNTLTLAGTDATTITFQGTDTYIGRATTDTLTNKTLTTPTINGPVLKLAAATVATLPTCNGGNTALKYYVTDALTPVALASVAGGGAVIISVFCNGTAWIVN